MKHLLVLNWEHLSLDNLIPYKDHKIVLIESHYECGIHKHHKKKLVFLLSSMRHFYAELKQTNEWDVEYLTSEKSFAEAAYSYAQSHGYKELNIIRPAEYRCYQQLLDICKDNIWLTMHEDKNFICDISDFAEWSKRQKGKLLMENFYRHIRVTTNILIDKGKPSEGRWNFDKENRKPMKTSMDLPNLRHNKIDPITREVIELVEHRFADHFGDVEPFYLEVTRVGAEKVLSDFLSRSLTRFGPYQDSMKEGEELIFHSCISSYLNVGLLNPLSICRTVEEMYNKGLVNIQSAEGFIRQILGWREFIRGIYWIKMPKYKQLNFLSYNRDLPALYWWEGKTDCNCLRQVISFTRKYAYSHHIQRLMITGNFAALLGVVPEQICEWYLCVYSDAHEWVELPNTLGMATYSDGGIVGTKPYIASGAYINRMSDFCKNCKYKWDQKTGKGACPFNYLYWNYLIEHQKKIENNQRMSMPYNTLKKMTEEQKKIIQDDSKEFIYKIANNE